MNGVVRALVRRFALPLALVAAAVAAVGLVAGLASGTALTRSVSLAFYLAGTVAALFGLLAGLSGPLRRDRDERGRRVAVRVATAEERSESRVVSVLLLAAGIALLLIGLVIDPRVRVV